MKTQTDMVSNERLSALGLTLIKERNGISEYKLNANGLKILLIPNQSSQAATVMIVYRVGSRNEAVGYTGSTHFLEHMMFKGTDRFPNFDERAHASRCRLQRHHLLRPHQLLRQGAHRAPRQAHRHGSRPHAQPQLAPG
jgi:hypothetical protein